MIPFKIWIFAGAVLFAFGSGYALSHKLFQAKLDAQQVIILQNSLEASRLLREAEQERLLLSQQLEDQANAAPVTSPACLPADRVRRLNLR